MQLLFIASILVFLTSRLFVVFFPYRERLCTLQLLSHYIHSIAVLCYPVLLVLIVSETCWLMKVWIPLEFSRPLWSWCWTLTSFFISFSVQFLFSLSFIFAVTGWWSEETFAPLFTLTSGNNRQIFLYIQMWSIWFSVTRSGETYVVLWILLC